MAGIMVCTLTWMRPRDRGPFWAAKAALRAKHGGQQTTQRAWSVDTLAANRCDSLCAWAHPLNDCTEFCRAPWST